MSLLSRGCECSKERHTFYIVNVDQESESVTDTTKGDIGKERIRNTVPFSLWTRHPCGWWSRRTASRRSAGSARSFQQLLFENGQTKSTVNKIHGFPMRAMLYSLLVDGAAVCSAEFMTMSLKEENMPFERVWLKPFFPFVISVERVTFYGTSLRSSTELCSNELFSVIEMNEPLWAKKWTEHKTNELMMWTE